MPIDQGILVALFCMVTVFAVLGILSVLIRLFSSLIRFFESKVFKNSSNTN